MQTYITEYFAFLLIVLFTAYLIPAGIFHAIFFRGSIEGIDPGRIQQRRPNWKIVQFEITHSLIATVLFALYATITYQFVKSGQTAMYFSWGDYPWWMPILGFAAAIGLWFVHRSSTLQLAVSPRNSGEGQHQGQRSFFRCC